MGHPNRSKRNSGPDANPTPAEVEAARKAAGLTESQAAAVIHASPRAWVGFETSATDGDLHRRMHPGLFELFLLKTGQKTLAESRKELK